MPTQRATFVQSNRAMARVVLAFLIAASFGAESMGDERSDDDVLGLGQSAVSVLQSYCFECHGNDLAEAKINLQRLSADRSFTTQFKIWQRVVEMLEQRKMPPEDMQQPSDAERRRLVDSIRAELQRASHEHLGDPGRVVMRRLTSAEYNYSIVDLTGLDLQLQGELIGDAVGGEGFANIGVVQFVDDATLERYLSAAKRVADHLVIGSGPLQFFRDPGKTGLELSAINRIQSIYRRYGFRSEAGEGGEPYGLDCYPRAFYAAWRYHHRHSLGLPDATFESVARHTGLTPRFVQHVYSVLQQQSPTFPTSAIVNGWRSLAPPRPEDAQLETKMRAASDELYQQLQTWQELLAGASMHEEEASLLVRDTFHVETSHQFRARFVCSESADAIKLTLSVSSVDPERAEAPIVVWTRPQVRYRQLDGRWTERQPLSAVLPPAAAAQFGFGSHPQSGEIAPHDFVTHGARSLEFELPLPRGTRQVQLDVHASLDVEHGPDGVIRAELGHEQDGRLLSALMGNPKGEAYASWKRGADDFARNFPQVSHREPAPSDRDPIPLPFDNSYNTRERDFFHYKVKYHRDDQFLVEHILDDSERTRLDEAWIDLLTSFEYHDVFLRFVVDKFGLKLGDRGVAELDLAMISRLPPEPRRHVMRLRQEFIRATDALEKARERHVQDVVEITGRAWRRPLSTAEERRLRAFYKSLRQQQELTHEQAIRATLTRTLVAPDFLYRAERITRHEHVVPVTDWELASRLSYFLWASLPDDELRRSAAAGSLSNPTELAAQARRMLKHPKARRLAQEFFGQWFGFYQFDRYRGVDPERFPEFDASLQAAMYEEAVTFFEYIIRHDRPASEILFADYAFVNDLLAEHYEIALAADSTDRFQRVDGVHRFHRGGLFGLGAILTSTSAPLRTSPVKRGDWILRRVVGTPVPPPPADAGSLPADDVLEDGLTLRQRLEAHRQQESCRNCHSRIDPLGFALEHYDAIGRWRERYRDGQAIDSAGVLNTGVRIEGVEGLRQYLRDHEDRFYRSLCAKMLGFALGRRELMSDAALLERMSQALQGGGSFSDAVEMLVTSRQFRTRRGLSDAAAEDPLTKNDASSVEE